MINPAFSIVVACYNRGGFLPILIKSIQNQQFKNYEIIIIDDGSTDDTEAAIKNLLSEEPRIKYVFQENAERGAARNTGIRNATGEYVLFIDSDDIMLPSYLSDLHELITKNPGYNFYSGKYLFSVNGKPVQTSSSKLPSGAHTIDTVLEGNPFGCNFCIKKNNPSLILFDEDRNLATTEDWMFLVENLLNDTILLGDFIGLYMMQHDARSMQENQKIIERRLRATEVLAKRNHFTPHQLKTLWAYTWAFCGVHAYLDCNWRQSLQFISKAIKRLGPNPQFLQLMIKFFIGRKNVLTLKRFIAGNGV